MKYYSHLVSIGKIMPIIIIDLALIFFVLNTYGHIDLLTDKQRADKIQSLENIIENEGCINRNQARQRLGLNRHEMIEVVRNASGYPRPGTSLSNKDIPSFPITTCYMAQKK